MDYSKRLARKTKIIIALYFVALIFLSIGIWQLFVYVFNQDVVIQLILTSLFIIIIIAILASSLGNLITKPLEKLSDIIVFAGHSNRGGTPPNIDKIFIGHELVTALARQIYDIASLKESSSHLTKSSDESLASNPQDYKLSILDQIGIPIIGLDAEQKITTINRAGSNFLNKKSADILNTPFYDAFNLSFDSSETFEQWLKNAQENTAVDTHTWERVRIVDPNGNALKQFDLVGSFSKDSQSGTETILAIFDRTKQYSRDDTEISFVSLAVHELRTPLTIMRGYIEVFEEEVGPTLNPEMLQYMNKMQASAQQLTAFVGNILNVARVEENQLVLKLKKNNWEEILKIAIHDLELRAQVYDKHIEVHIAENLPDVAVDRISIHEVINNLVDNAIKYSKDSKKIVIKSVVDKNGMIETSVQDFGLGVPQSTMPDLFQKYFRSHKSRAQVGGTGLGLYLCRAIVNAHGGNIWVRSKEGEGSTFTFTLQPYDQVKHEKDDSQDGIMRGAHGWIKNHNLNRQ